MNIRSLPDLAGLVRTRLANPAPLLEGQADAEYRIGRSILRQVTDEATAPGGAAAIRMSNLGNCARQLAYRLDGVPEDGRKRDGRMAATFAMGDATEMLLSVTLTDALATDMGPEGWRMLGIRSATGQFSVHLNLQVPGTRVPLRIAGHPDGVLSVPASDPHLGPWVERYGLTRHGEPSVVAAVIEIKSSSSYGVSLVEKRLAAGQPGWTRADSYWWQLQAYMHAVRAPLAYVLMLGKDSGHVVGWWQPVDHQFRDSLRAHLEPVIGLGPEVPRRLADGTELKPGEATYYKRGGTRRDGTTYTRGDRKGSSGKLPWNCAYCSHFRACWGESLDERIEKDYRGRPSRALYVKPIVVEE